MVESVGDDGYAEAVGLGIAYRQAHAVDRHRPFLHCHITLAHQLRVHRIAELEIGAAVHLLYGNALGAAVDVALHDMAVQAPVDAHASLQVHQVAYLKQPQIGAIESLLYCRHGVCVVAVEAYHRQAHAVVRQALVDMKFVGEAAGDPYVQVAPLALKPDYTSGLLYYS